MMIQEKITWQEINDKFDHFEEKFIADPIDPSLTKVFDDFAEKVLNGDFNKEQMLQIRDRIINFRKTLATTREQLVQKGVKAISDSKQMTTYVKNANYKYN